jgi:hypothetical protein
LPIQFSRRVGCNCSQHDAEETAEDRPMKTGHGKTPWKQTFEGLNDRGIERSSDENAGG